MTKSYEKYKNSGVEWIGDIPEHWEEENAGYNLELLMGFPADSKLFNFSIGFPLIRIRDLLESKIETFYNGTFPEKYIVKIGDHLIGMDGDYHNVIWNNENALLNQRVMMVKTKKKLERKFFYYSIGFYLKIINDLTYATTVKHLSDKDVRKQKIQIPPPLEQQKISSYLDKKSEEIDQFIKNKENLIKLLDEEKKTLITQAVTKGINPDVSYKNSGVEWIGDIPEHWEVIKLKFSTTIFRGKFTHRPRNDPALYDGEYPFIQTGDVAKAGKFLFKYKQTLNKRGLKVSTIFPKGTIVITIAANIGDISILDINACFPDSVVGFNPNKFLERDFLYYVLISMKQQFIESTIENTQMNLNIDRIGKNSITLLPILEQQQIITYIEEKTQKIDDLKAKYRQEIDLIKEYKERLIYDMVTGKINVL